MVTGFIELLSRCPSPNWDSRSGWTSKGWQFWHSLGWEGLGVKGLSWTTTSLSERVPHVCLVWPVIQETLESYTSHVIALLRRKIMEGNWTSWLVHNFILSLSWSWTVCCCALHDSWKTIKVRLSTPRHSRNISLIYHHSSIVSLLFICVPIMFKCS